MNVPYLPLDPEAGRQLDWLENLFDSLPMGIAVIDEQFVLRRFNPAWSNLIGRCISSDADQVTLGKSLFEFIPGIQATFVPLLERVLSGETLHREAFRWENDGSVCYWDLTLIPLIDNEQTTSIISVIVDVTERVIAHQKTEVRTEARTQELAALQEISYNLISTELEPSLNLILERLKIMVDYSSAAIWTLEDSNFTLLAYQGPIPQEKISKLPFPLAGEQVSQEVVQRQAPTIISDTQNDTPQARAFREWSSEHLEITPSRIRSWVGIPLVHKEQVLGMLTLHHFEPDYYSPHRAKLALAFADYIALAIENDRLYQQALGLATLEERDRLARELHDNLAQTLGYLNLKITGINQLIVAEKTTEAQAELRELKQIVNETYTDVREEIFNLRAATSLGLGFPHTLREYLSKYKKYYHLDVELAIGLDESLLEFSTDVGSQIIRVIQEALINVRKHAQVNEARISFRQEQDYVRVSVEDTGVGFDLSQMESKGSSGIGLQIMRERTASIGGKLEIVSTPGRGSQLIIWVPKTTGK